MGVEMLTRLLPSDPRQRRRFIEACLNRLLPLQNFFRRQTSFAFYSSSILILYAGDPEALSSSSSSLDFHSDGASFSTATPPSSSTTLEEEEGEDPVLVSSQSTRHLLRPKCVLCGFRGPTLDGEEKSSRSVDSVEALLLESARSFTHRVDRCRDDDDVDDDGTPISGLPTDETNGGGGVVLPARSPTPSSCSCSSSSSSFSTPPPSSTSSSSSSSHSSSPSRATETSSSSSSSPRSAEGCLSPRLYLIDFAHAYHVTEVGLSGDLGCARGLDNLVAHFNSYLRLCR